MLKDEERYKLIQGDCLEVMKTIPDESVDCVITDPPYFLSSQRVYSKIKNISEIKGDGSLRENIEENTAYSSLVAGFMGKKWDGFRDIYDYQNFSKKWAIETLRILKHGGFLFSFGGTRTYHRMTCGIEDAGFIINNCMIWAYASGFPKAQDLAMSIEKKLGGEGEDTGIHNPNERPNCDKNNTLFESGTVGKKIIIKKPTLPEAKEWAGWKTAQLKPAYETIVVAQKPVEGTIAENTLKFGVGGFNIDECRIPLENDYEYKETNRTGKRGGGNGVFGENVCGLNNENSTIASASPEGRFPPNLLSEDNVLDDGKNKIAGKYKGEGSKEGGIWQPSMGKPAGREYEDSGSQNRYFDLDAWWNERIKKLPKEQQKTFPFLFVPKASRSEKNEGMVGIEENEENLQGLDTRGRTLIREDGSETLVKQWKGKASKNNHPTCKPLKIISYLITLATKPNAIVLDPFLGSGTTAIACEMLGRRWIGIEKEEEYIKIAEGRLSEWKKQTRL